MKIKLLLLLLFLTINSTVYFITDFNQKDKINIVLNDNLKTLTIYYKILLATQKKIAIGLYETTLNMDKVIEVMKEANNASQEKKEKLRAKLHHLVKKRFQIAKKLGILQYHFILPNNESFYRAHKPSKFGDDLTDIRADIKYTNKTKKSIRGFNQGKTSHAFRNIFPIFDLNNQYIGALDIAFSSDNLQWYLNNLSEIHSHFLVKKIIFDVKSWKRDDLVIKYTQSAEAKDYMLTLVDIHTEERCVIENGKKLEPIREELDSRMLLKEAFSTYVKYQDHFETISLLPIKNIDGEMIAWIVSFNKSDTIKSTIQSSFIVRIVTFLLSLLILYFLDKLINSKKEIDKKNINIEKQHKLVNDILNTTDNIMIVTDFIDIKFSNDKFKNMFNIEHTNIFNRTNNHRMLNIFVSANGYLHSNLLEDGEDFLSLLLRTDPVDRIVSIIDKNFEQKAFKISISKAKNDGDYLLTLSDITQMKEKQIEIEKKAYIDDLTKIYNRNKFDAIFEEEIKNSKRYKIPFSVAIIDIDKFKNFNDTYGHLIGDEVLITMAQTVNSSVRETDIFARWGGEEFVILFKNTSIDNASKVSEKIKNKIEENKHPIAGKITASFGVTEYKNDDTTESMFQRCDNALYVAKKNGRNRVEVL